MSSSTYKKIFVGSMIVALASIGSTAFSQKPEVANTGVKFLGVGPSVTAKVIDTRSFAKQINPGVAPYRKEMKHEALAILPGKSNSLTAGGLNNLIGIARLGTAFPAIGSTGAEPPDPDLAVGPTAIVNVVNSDLAFFTKTGQKTFQQSFQNFFKSVSPESFDFDPKVVYDQVAGKFIVLQLGLNDASSNGTSSLLIGVSDTSNPNGTWKLFKVDVKQTEGSNNFWLDYPGLGVNKDSVVISGNMFAMQGSSGYNGVQIIAFPKDTLYSGTATPSKFKVGGGTAQFGKAYDSIAPAVYAVQSSSFTAMTLTAVQRNGSAFTVTQKDVPVPSWSTAPGQANGVNGRTFDTVGPRVFSVAQRGDRLVASHTVRGANGSVAARWYDFKLNNWPAGAAGPSLSQSGNVEPPTGNSYVFPSISIDRAGGLGLAVCNLSPTTTGQILVSGRRVNDPIGTMSVPTLLETAPGTTYTGFSNRWGDYLDTEIDPADNTTFWTVGMGAGTNGKWLTLINKFRISPDSSSFTNLLPTSLSVQSGTYVSGNQASFGSVDGVNYMLNSQMVNGLGQVAGYNLTFKAPSNQIDLLRAQIALRAASGSTVIIQALNNSTNKYEQIDALAMTGSQIMKTIDFTEGRIASYVKADGTIQLSIRAVASSRGKVLPPVFNFTTDQFIFQYIPRG